MFGNAKKKAIAKAKLVSSDGFRIARSVNDILTSKAGYNSDCYPAKGDDMMEITFEKYEFIFGKIYIYGERLQLMRAIYTVSVMNAPAKYGSVVLGLLTTVKNKELYASLSRVRQESCWLQR